MNRPVIKQSSRRLLLWGLALMGISGGAFLFFVWQPRQAELSAMALRQAELRRTRLEMEGFHRRHPDFQGFEQALEARGERGERLFPQGERKSESFVRKDLPELAEAMGLSVEQIAAGNERDKGSQTPAEAEKILKPVTYSLTLRGEYGSLTDFLVRLEQGEPFAAVKGWQLKPGVSPGRKGELTLEMAVEIYERRQPFANVR